MFHWWTLYRIASSINFVLSCFLYVYRLSNRTGRFGISFTEKDSFQTSLRRVDEKPPIWWTVFLFQSLKEATAVTPEDRRTVHTKNVFKPYIFLGSSKIWHHSFILEARSSALSFDREMSRMTSFNSCWLNRLGSEVLSPGTYWSSEECRMASGEEPSHIPFLLKSQSSLWSLWSW